MVSLVVFIAVCQQKGDLGRGGEGFVVASEASSEIIPAGKQATYLGYTQAVKVLENFKKESGQQVELEGENEYCSLHGFINSTRSFRLGQWGVDDRQPHTAVFNIHDVTPMVTVAHERCQVVSMTRSLKVTTKCWPTL